MPSHISADRPAQPPGRGSVDALISRARQLKGDVDAVRRDSGIDGSDPQERWQRALYDLALHQLSDLDEHLAQLRDGPPSAPSDPITGGIAELGAPRPAPGDSLLSRVGTAEWNLLTDAASWSEELYEILGRSRATPALTLDELPSLVHEEDRPKLTAMVTDCLVDAKPIDGEFRILGPDGGLRTVHMMGEPVLDTDGSTASMWAVLRDVSELRRSQRTVRETRESLHRHRQQGRLEQQPRLTAEPPESALPPRHGSPRLTGRVPRTLDVTAHRLSPTTARSATPIGDGWCDALELPGGDTLLSVGDLTGQEVGSTSGTSMLLGALRGMAMTGTQPGQLLSLLGQLMESDEQPALGSAVCCRYRPSTRTLAWAHAGRPAPLLFRDGTGRMLDAPDGVLLGATASGATYDQAEVTLEPGDLLLLHSDGLMPGQEPADAADRLLGLAPRLGAAHTAQDCVRTVMEECAATELEDDACVLIAKVSQ